MDKLTMCNLKLKKHYVEKGLQLKIGIEKHTVHYIGKCIIGNKICKNKTCYKGKRITCDRERKTLTKPTVFASLANSSSSSSSSSSSLSEFGHWRRRRRRRANMDREVLEEGKSSVSGVL